MPHVAAAQGTRPHVAAASGQDRTWHADSEMQHSGGLADCGVSISSERLSPGSEPLCRGAENKEHGQLEALELEVAEDDEPRSSVAWAHAKRKITCAFLEGKLAELTKQSMLEREGHAAEASLLKQQMESLVEENTELKHLLEAQGLQAFDAVATRTSDHRKISEVYISRLEEELLEMKLNLEASLSRTRAKGRRALRNSKGNFLQCKKANPRAGAASTYQC
jgi:hypothetical protein